ncbi:MAG: putative peptidase [Saprospiraceae bacterium]|jgi:predicted peptidase
MKLLKPIHFALLIVLFCSVSITLSFSQASPFDVKIYVNNEGDTLNYRQLTTDYNSSRKYPLVIFLHGSGERGDDNEAQLLWGVENFATDQNMKLHPSIVIAPQCPKNEGWGNFSDSMTLQPSPTHPMKLVLELINQAILQLPVDTNRIYITGLSMGGFGTFDAIARNPNLFAAAVPVCGGGDILKAKSISHIPIWIFLGAEDPVVNPVYSLSMLEALREVGAHPGFTLYPEVGHFAWIAAYSDEMMMEWLFRQRK